MIRDDDITIAAGCSDEIEADSPLALTDEGHALLAVLTAPQRSEDQADGSVE